MPYPEPLSTWNRIVKSSVTPLDIHITPIESGGSGSYVEKDKEYYLELAICNTCNYDLTYENVVVRFVGRADQVEFIDPPGVIDNNGRPRVHLESGLLKNGQHKGWRIRFKARRDMHISYMKFDTGFYGYLVPQGHFWKSMSPVLLT